MPRSATASPTVLGVACGVLAWTLAALNGKVGRLSLVTLLTSILISYGVGALSLWVRPGQRQTSADAGTLARGRLGRYTTGFLLTVALPVLVGAGVWWWSVSQARF
ncbi:hypothetical protein E7T06_08295 [Deinococcus sp. Arct2-2]|uniref:hypothetical protein n=1 Tax=Deinococcus sp. Arct2-2 TaxID=2568653 RepID=UPI0010A2E95D|nr:hypothetical protein [Deinococcus sp. Arct2-2]THF70176.1 hypothetical protein E7T06_08295 [Deinococcus sp. Arct2-2]